MTQRELFEAWAPSGARWSPWVKPVLFASLPESIEPANYAIDLPAADLSWVPPAASHTAIVIDLPGVEGAMVGIALAAQGYQPVPLYNAHPGPLTPSSASVSVSLVNLHDVVRVIISGTPLVVAAGVDSHAPPAFLLDANRRIGYGPASPGRFDNRSVSFPTDFPSANFLQNCDISKVLLVQRNGNRPQADLAHTLRGWASGGIEISVLDLDQPAPAIRCDLSKPWRVQLWWHFLTATLGLRRHPLGGFGGLIPEISAGG